MSEHTSETPESIEFWRRGNLQIFVEIIERAQEIFEDVKMMRTGRTSNQSNTLFDFGDLFIDDLGNVLFKGQKGKMLISTRRRTATILGKICSERFINDMGSIEEAKDLWVKLQKPLATLNRHADQMWMMLGVAVREEAAQTLAQSYQFN